MFSIVTVFELFSHVSSTFWSGDNMNQVIRHFLGQDFDLSRQGVKFLMVSTWSFLPLFSRPG